MSLYQFIEAIQLGLIFSLVVMGVYLSFRVLNFPDLTVEGSFPLGGAITAVMITKGFNPWIGLLLASLGGFIAGTVTAWLNVKWKILHLLAGILTMTALYSINLRIMGQPNISLLNMPTVFLPLESTAFLKSYILPVAILFLSFIALFVLYFFLSSETGLAMRATGANPRMARSQGINDGLQIIVGIGLSNAFVAFGGGLFVQMLGSANVTDGYGKIVEGIAAVIIGEIFIRSRRILWALLGCILGAIFYRIAVALALEGDIIGLRASDLSLITAIIIALAMIFPQFIKKVRMIPRRSS